MLLLCLVWAITVILNREIIYLVIEESKKSLSLGPVTMPICPRIEVLLTMLVMIIRLALIS